MQKHTFIKNVLIHRTIWSGQHIPGNKCEVPLSLAAEADMPLASRRRAKPWRPSLLWCWELSGGLGGLLSRQRPIKGRLVPTVIENLCISQIMHSWMFNIKTISHSGMPTSWLNIWCQYLLTNSMGHSHCRANRSSAKKSSLHCMEPKGSLLHSQAPATHPYPEPDKFCPHLPIYLFKINFNIIIPSVPRSSKWFLCFRFPHQSHVHISPLPHACQMPHHSHPPWLHHPITLMRSEDHKTLFMKQFTPISSHSRPLMSTYLPRT